MLETILLIAVAIILWFTIVNTYNKNKKLISLFKIIDKQADEHLDDFALITKLRKSNASLRSKLQYARKRVDTLELEVSEKTKSRPSAKSGRKFKK